MAVIEIKNLTKDYGHNRGVFDVTFSVQKGEVYGFLGPNGAGKTTAIRHVMGFSKPQIGSTAVNGMDCWTNASEIQQNLGYLPGEIALPEALTGTEFIQMMANLRGIKDMVYTDYLMGKFKLDPTGPLKKMSLGMKRKLAIVTAFMHDPEVLVLDEPTSGLDPIMQNVFIEFIREEKKRGKSILISSHIFKEIDATCDKISIIKDGHLVSTFIAEDLRNQDEKRYQLVFSTEDDLQQFLQVAPAKTEIHMESVQHEKCEVTVKINLATMNDFISFMSQFELASFSEIPFSLEDYFMEFYDRKIDIQEGASADGTH